MIECKLKCKCTDGEVTLMVRERMQGEDIERYMEMIQRQVGIWHQHRQCDATTLEYLKLPLPNEEKGIGFG